MENIKSHKREIFWYNMAVPRKRGCMFFDIGSRKLQRRPGRFCNVWGTFGPEHSLAGQNPGVAVSLKPPPTVGRDDPSAPPLVGSRVPRDRRSGELRKRIRRPQHVRNSVLGFVAKPLTLHNEKPNTMVRRVTFTRRALFSCFSSRFLAAPATRQGFEGAPLSFSAPWRWLLAM